MPSPIATLRSFAEQLSSQEQKPSQEVVQALGGTASNVQYLGIGREMTSRGKHFGLYVKSEKYGLAPRDNGVFFSFVSMPEADGVRHELGTFGLVAGTDDRIATVTHSFKRRGSGIIAAETLMAPLGRWAARTLFERFVMTDSASGFPPRQFVTPGSADMSPLTAFIANRHNKPTYIRFMDGVGTTDRVMIHEAA